DCQQRPLELQGPGANLEFLPGRAGRARRSPKLIQRITELQAETEALKAALDRSVDLEDPADPGAEPNRAVGPARRAAIEQEYAARMAELTSLAERAGVPATTPPRIEVSAPPTLYPLPTPEPS